MKKLFLVLVSAAVLGLVPAVAEQNTYSKPGSVTAQVGIGAYYDYYGYFNLEGGIDVGLAQVPFAPVFPVDFGVAGRVGFGTWGAMSVGAFGTAHYSWKALGTRVEWIDALETYVALGLAILPEISLDGYGGTAYHFDKNLAVFVEGGYFGSIIGVSYRF